MGVLMRYYLSRTVSTGFDDTVRHVVAALQVEGFGLLTDIDVRATLQKKLGVEFRNYRILGACNPPLALKALEAESKIGVMLPCNVIIQEHAGGKVEVAAIDPTVAMQSVGNPGLGKIAADVRDRLARVVAAIPAG